jgi:predicted amidophosphoribosyltransferase
MLAVKNIFSNTLHLFYPHICTGCGSDLINKNSLLCFNCINDLPHTNFASYPATRLKKFLPEGYH